MRKTERKYAIIVTDLPRPGGFVSSPESIVMEQNLEAGSFEKMVERARTLSGENRHTMVVEIVPTAVQYFNGKSVK